MCVCFSFDFGFQIQILKSERSFRLMCLQFLLPLPHPNKVHITYLCQDILIKQQQKQDTLMERTIYEVLYNNKVFYKHVDAFTLHQK